MKSLVIDGSAALGFLLQDERSTHSEKILREMEKGAPNYVPSHWWLETANALLAAERSKRISFPALTEVFNVLRALPVLTDDETEQHSTLATVSLAREYGLTVYDAAYLELALRRKSSLATFDKQLAAAARSAGVNVLH